MWLKRKNFNSTNVQQYKEQFPKTIFCRILSIIWKRIEWKSKKLGKSKSKWCDFWLMYILKNSICFPAGHFGFFNLLNYIVNSQEEERLCISPKIIWCGLLLFMEYILGRENGFRDFFYTRYLSPHINTVQVNSLINFPF